MMDTMLWPVTEPNAGADPNALTVPFAPTSQYPLPSGVAAMAEIGAAYLRNTRTTVDE